MTLLTNFNLPNTLLIIGEPFGVVLSQFGLPQRPDAHDDDADTCDP